MNFLESEVAILESRLKRIQENPDPTKMKSNTLLYSLELDMRKSQLAAWKAGLPFACATGTATLLRALGFEYLDLHQISDRVKDTDKYVAWIEANGYPTDACDRTVTSLSMPLLGDVPKPSFVISSNGACTPLMLLMNTIAYEVNASLYNIDIPTTEDEPSEEMLQYVTEQISGLVAFAEKNVPGIRYDEKN